MNANSKRILASISILLGCAFSSASFAQSGTISFSGRILAPACTATSNSNIQNANTNFDININSCANSEAIVARSSISSSANSNSHVTYLSSNTSTTNYSARTIADESDDSSAIITVTYE